MNLFSLAALVLLSILPPVESLQTRPVAEIPLDAPRRTFIAGPEGTPLIRGMFTADPAVLVHGGRLYLYTGRDETPAGARHYLMREWRCYSTQDMKTWRDEGVPLRAADFKWAGGDAWASQVIEREGRFLWYAPVRNADKDHPGFAIGVAVADTPAGPFRDVLGRPLITNDMTPQPADRMDWDDIDPTVIVDHHGTPYLMWGNSLCKVVRLKPSMLELDGAIKTFSREELPWFTEAPWIHYHNKTYYLTYAHGFPESIGYATASEVMGPYKFRSVILAPRAGSGTSHQAVVEFQGKWWFFYHTADLPGGGDFHRSVTFRELTYGADGAINPIEVNVGPGQGEGAVPRRGTTRPDSEGPALK